MKFKVMVKVNSKATVKVIRKLKVIVKKANNLSVQQYSAMVQGSILEMCILVGKCSDITSRG